MPMKLDDFIEILAEICHEEKLKCTLTSSLKGGVITGAAATIGGLLLGPIGLAVGGALGGAVSATVSKNFRPVPQILRSMPEEKKSQLCNKVVYAFREFGIKDMMAVAALLVSQTAMKQIAIQEVTSYLTQTGFNVVSQ